MRKLLLKTILFVFLVVCLLTSVSCDGLREFKFWNKKDYYYCKIEVNSSDGKEETPDIISECLASLLEQKGYDNVDVICKNGYFTVKIFDSDFGSDRIYEDILSVCKIEELTFRLYDNSIALYGGDCIANARCGYDKDGNPIIVLELTRTGQERFAQVTETVLGYEDSNRILNVYFGDRLLVSPRVSTKVDSPNIEITGIDSIEEARFIVSNILMSIRNVKLNMAEFGKVD